MQVSKVSVHPLHNFKPWEGKKQISKLKKQTAVVIKKILNYYIHVSVSSKS